VNTTGRPHRDAACGAATSPAAEAARVARDAVRAVRAGDVEAFGRVVDEYQCRNFAVALMLSRDGTAAEEIAQDAFVRAFTHLDAYDERLPFYPWLATIAVRLAQNWQVKRSRDVSRESDLAPYDEPATSDDQLAALIAEDEVRRLWRAVAALPWGERTAALLYYRQELGVSEIASVPGVTAGTVKTLLFRARQRLRRGDLAEKTGRGAV
jgi:RNA polymerase sigma-70 factor (ECF subfamily)